MTPVTCDWLDDRLSDYLEETLVPAERAAVERHLAGCARCAELVADLRSVTREAASLPPLRPSRDLWSGIEARIAADAAPLGLPIGAAAPATPAVAPTDDARVLPFERPAARPHRTWRWAGLAAAALALVLGTRELTLRGMLGQGAPSAVAVTPAAAHPAPAPVAAPPQVATGVPYGDRSAATPELSRTAGPTLVRAVRRVRTLGPEARAAADARRSYDHEIAQLDGILRERRQQLDPKTVQVLEHSLRVIDDAIAQSRRALVKDPASAFLGEELNRALDKKMELLRTAALLPART